MELFKVPSAQKFLLYWKHNDYKKDVVDKITIIYDDDEDETLGYSLVDFDISDRISILNFKDFTEELSFKDDRLIVGSTPDGEYLAFRYANLHFICELCKENEVKELARIQYTTRKQLWENKNPGPYTKISFVGYPSYYEGVDYIYCCEMMRASDPPICTLIMPVHYARYVIVTTILCSSKDIKTSLDNLHRTLDLTTVPIIFGETPKEKQMLNILASTIINRKYESYSKYNLVKLCILHNCIQLFKSLLKSHRDAVLTVLNNVFVNCNRTLLIQNIKEVNEFNWYFIHYECGIKFPSDILLCTDLPSCFVACMCNLGYNWNFNRDERQTIKWNNLTKIKNLKFHPFLNWNKHNASLFISEFRNRMKMILLYCFRVFGKHSFVYASMKSTIIWMIGQKLHLAETEYFDKTDF